MKKHDQKPPVNWIVILMVAFIMILLWVGNWLYVESQFCQPEEKGTFGDQFGAINALFSGLALAGIILSLVIQRKEFRLQRDELKDTREEFEHQSFQTTFFNLLRNQREIADSVSASIIMATKNGVDGERTEPAIGRSLFYLLMNELGKISRVLSHDGFIVLGEEDLEEMRYAYGTNDGNPQTDWDVFFEKLDKNFLRRYYGIKPEYWEASKSSPEENARISFVILYQRYSFVLAHYFRHLYQIVQFLDRSRLEKLEEMDRKNDTVRSAAINGEYHQYAQFVQAQMSPQDLFLLHYNCYSFPKMLELVKRYNLLENLDSEDLISEDHELEEMNLKRRGNMFQQKK